MRFRSFGVTSLSLLSLSLINVNVRIQNKCSVHTSTCSIELQHQFWNNKLAYTAIGVNLKIQLGNANLIVSAPYVQ